VCTNPFFVYQKNPADERGGRGREGYRCNGGDACDSKDRNIVTGDGGCGKDDEERTEAGTADRCAVASTQKTEVRLAAMATMGFRRRR